MINWEGRSWVDASPIHLDKESLSSFKVVSYRFLAHFKTAFMYHSLNKAWEDRSKIVIQELKCYDADIFCFQDIDFYKEFWAPQLMLLGYDSIFKSRTQEKEYHYEGLIIAYRRERFQLFKSSEIDFNLALQDDSKGVAFRERCKTDDVGLLAFLQTIQKNDLPTSLCVACAMFSESTLNSEIRTIHAQYFSNRIEQENKDFQVPVVMGINLNDNPSSSPYILLRTGRFPLTPTAPPKCTSVKAIGKSRATVLLTWLPPKVSLADPPVTSYHISWRPGASRTLGFSSQIEVNAVDCINYVEVVDRKGNRKIKQDSLMHFTLTGLCAEMPFEFRVRGVNEKGLGVWSDASEPIVLPNPEKAYSLPPLENFADLDGVMAVREQQEMEQYDYNANAGVVVDLLNPTTQLTPRTIEGSTNNNVPRSKVLPLRNSVRGGWKDSLNGVADKVLLSELQRDYVVGKSILRDKEGFKEEGLNHYNDLDIKSPFTKLNGESAMLRGDDGSTFLLDCKEVMNRIGGANPRQAHELLLRSAYESYGCGGEPLFTSIYPKQNDSQGMDCGDYIFYSSAGLVVNKVLSIPNLLDMRRGETPELKNCRADNIIGDEPFLNATASFDRRIESLFKRSINSSAAVPVDLESLMNRSVSKGELAEIKRSLKGALNKSHAVKEVINNDPPYARKKNATAPKPSLSKVEREVWGGRWVPFPCHNDYRTTYQLPNAEFPSTHIAIGAEFLIDENLLAYIRKD